MINIGMIIGRLTKDPEMRYITTANGQMGKCRFSVAVNDGWGEKAQTLYFNIVTWGKLAESCEKNLSKGKQVAVAGKMMPGSYQNKEGQRVNTFEIVANTVDFLSPKTEVKAENKDMGVPTGFAKVEGEGIPF